MAGLYILYTYRPIVGFVISVTIMTFINATSCLTGCCSYEYHYINYHHKTHNRSAGTQDIKAAFSKNDLVVFYIDLLQTLYTHEVFVNLVMAVTTQKSLNMVIILISET